MKAGSQVLFSHCTRSGSVPGLSRPSDRQPSIRGLDAPRHHALVLAAVRGAWYTEGAMKANDFTPEQNEAAIRSMLFVADPQPPPAIRKGLAGEKRRERAPRAPDGRERWGGSGLGAMGARVARARNAPRGC